MSKTEMRIHGHVVVIQDWFNHWLQQKLIVLEDARGKTFQELSNGLVKYWFHIPIPAPKIINGVIPTLNKIFIEYTCTRTKADVYISEVHIYDGNYEIPMNVKNQSNIVKKFWEYSDMGYSYSHTQKEWTIPSKPNIKYGLGITVQAVFATPKGALKTIPSSIDYARSIQFHAAGAEFETP